MTDFARVNNVYYDMNVYNSTQTPIPAEINNKLLFPLLNTSDDYSVSLAKSKVPLQSIPLTQSNIPLKTYELGIKIGTTEETAYVRQINANQNNFVWNCPKNSNIITKYQYTGTGALILQSVQDVSAITPFVNQYVVDDYSNIYILGGLVKNRPNMLYVIDEDTNLIFSQTFVYLKHIYIDRGQNLYLCDESTTPTVYIYSNNNSIGSVALTPLSTLTTNKANTPLVNLVFCIADNEIIVGYNQNTITLYNSQFQAQTDIVETAIKQLQNRANINANAGTYILSNTNALNDTLWGTQSNNEVYVVNTNTQLTNGSVATPACATSNGEVYAGGTDNKLYYFGYPTTYPASFTQLSSTANVANGGIWTRYDTNNIYAIGLAQYEYYIFNYSASVGDFTQPNTFTKCGIFNISTSPNVNPINIDVNPLTRQLVGVGTDNNLYQTNFPIAGIEYIALQTQIGTPYQQMIGIGSTNLEDSDDIFNVRQLPDSTASTLNCVGMFKRGIEYYTYYNNTGTSQIDLIIRKESDFSEISTTAGFIKTMYAPTYLPLAQYFVYYGSNNPSVPEVSVYNLNTSTYVQQFTFFPTPTAFCEIDINHYCVLTFSTINIFNYSSTTPILSYSTDSVFATDVACNPNYLNNGASTLFVLTQPDIPTSPNTFSSNIVQYTFADNTYTSVASATTLYSQPDYPTNGISLLSCHTNSGRLMFTITPAVGQPQPYPPTTLNTLYPNDTYSFTSMTSGVLPIPISSASAPYYTFTKYTTYLNQDTTSTKLWGTVNTGGVAVKAVSVSKSNPNTLYCVASSNSNIYNGNLLGSSCPLTIINEFATQQYNYISNIVNDDPTFESTLYLYNTQNGQTLITSLVLGDEAGTIARNDTANQYIVSKKNANAFTAYNPSTLTSIFTSSLTGAYSLFAKNGSDVDAGAYSIYNMSELINSINNAFIEVQTKINQSVGAGTLTQAPSLTLNYTNGLCTLSYPSKLTTSGNGILFNQNLLNIIYFVSTPDTLSPLNLLTLNSQAESITQNINTINLFNQLDKILYRSDTIYVVGAYFGLNDSNNIFFDIDVPTADFVENINQTLYFQPNFLRTYFLRSNLPLDNISIKVYYQYRDGSYYPLVINAGQNTTTKLQFVRKF